MKIILPILSLGTLGQARLRQPHSRSLELYAETQAAIDKILKPPGLELITEEDVEEDQLLGMCHGDCDSDDDCMGDLVCFQRSDGDAVPGCSLSEEEPDAGGSITVVITKTAVTSLETSTDFCVFPTVEVVGENPIPDEGEATDDAPIDEDDLPLGLCHGYVQELQNWLTTACYAPYLY